MSDRPAFPLLVLSASIGVHRRQMELVLVNLVNPVHLFFILSAAPK